MHDADRGYREPPLRETRARAYQLLDEGGDRTTLQQELGIRRGRADELIADYKLYCHLREGLAPLAAGRLPFAEVLLQHGWRLTDQALARLARQIVGVEEVLARDGALTGSENRTRERLAVLEPEVLARLEALRCRVRAGIQRELPNGLPSK